jgi:hypothetical protein
MSGWRRLDSLFDNLKDLFAPGILDEKVEDPPQCLPPNTIISELTYPDDMPTPLHQDGSWYIVPQGFIFTYFGTNVNGNPIAPFDSHIVHICSKSWIVKSEPDERGVEKPRVYPNVVARLRYDRIIDRCEHCDETPSDGLVGLWKLHNWDYLCLND